MNSRLFPPLRWIREKPGPGARGSPALEQTRGEALSRMRGDATPQLETGARHGNVILRGKPGRGRRSDIEYAIRLFALRP